MRIPNFSPVNFTYTNQSRRYSNLAPLSYDCCSFSGTKKSHADDASFSIEKSKSNSASKAIDKSERATHMLTQRIHDEADYAFKQLKFRLDNIFDEDVIDTQASDAKIRINRKYTENRNNPIVYICARRKSPDSIAEKMAQKHIKGRKEAIEELNDLIGARIIVSGTGQQEGNYVIDRLTEGVKKGRLKIRNIKLHSQENSSLNYVSKGKLNKLVTAARKNGSPLCTFTDEPRDTGYLAVHIITDEIEDGYNSEIQIMGVDVQEFKEIEDLIYKCLADKNVDNKYNKIEELFKPLRTNQEKREEYYEYAKRAYAYERKKPIHDKKNTLFLSMPDDIALPKELDFNNIARLKKLADKNSKS